MSYKIIQYNRIKQNRTLLREGYNYFYFLVSHNKLKNVFTFLFVYFLKISWYCRTKWTSLLNCHHSSFISFCYSVGIHAATAVGNSFKLVTSLFLILDIIQIWEREECTYQHWRKKHRCWNYQKIFFVFHLLIIQSDQLDQPGRRRKKSRMGGCSENQTLLCLTENSAQLPRWSCYTQTCKTGFQTKQSTWFQQATRGRLCVCVKVKRWSILTRLCIFWVYMYVFIYF